MPYEKALVEVNSPHSSSLSSTMPELLHSSDIPLSKFANFNNGQSCSTTLNDGDNFS